MKIALIGDFLGYGPFPDEVIQRVQADRHLGSAARAYLSRLPEQRRLELPSWSVLLCHGSPVSSKEHLMPDTSSEHLEELARIANTRIIVCGHSHRPGVRAP